MRIVKKYVFFHFESEKGFFGGYKQVWPPSFSDNFYAKKIQGLFTGPLGPNPKFWGVHFFRNYITFPTIYNTWGFGWIWGQRGQNKKINFFENFMRKLVARRRIAIWDQTVARIKKLKKTYPHFFFNGGLFSTTFWLEPPFGLKLRFVVARLIYA